MTTNLNKSGQWFQYIALALAFIGMLASVGGSLLFFLNEARIGSSIWPLPGLVLTDWAILGVLGFDGAYFGIKPLPTFWLRVTWFVVGALLPLIILRAFSIGSFVLISFLFLLASAILIAVLKEMNWLNNLGMAMLGAVCNLGLVYLFIVLNSAVQN